MGPLGFEAAHLWSCLGLAMSQRQCRHARVSPAPDSGWASSLPFLSRTHALGQSLLRLDKRTAAPAGAAGLGWGRELQQSLLDTGGPTLSGSPASPQMRPVCVRVGEGELAPQLGSLKAEPPPPAHPVFEAWSPCPLSQAPGWMGGLSNYLPAQARGGEPMIGLSGHQPSFAGSYGRGTKRGVPGSLLDRVAGP